MSQESEGTRGEEELAAMLADADALSATEDWDKAILAYRKLLAFDRFSQGAEAKLQWALRMRDIDKLYRQGLAELEAARYPEARGHLTKARLLFASQYKDADKLIIETWYAQGKTALAAGNLQDALSGLRKARELSKSHYKDTDALIIQAETDLQKKGWAARPPAASGRKGCFLLGSLLLLAIFGMTGLAGCAPAAATPAAAVPSGGGAAQVQPAQRSEMYKAPPALKIDPSKKYTATIKTAKGDIVANLFASDAPQTVNNFIFLARDGFFNNLTFHRVEPGFVIQGGDPLGTGIGGPGYTVPAEIKRPHPQGALAMARQGDQVNPTRASSGSQFYITLAATPNLDGAYTVFGQVTGGMDIAQKIARGDIIQTITIQEQ